MYVARSSTRWFPFLFQSRAQCAAREFLSFGGGADVKRENPDGRAQTHPTYPGMAAAQAKINRVPAPTQIGGLLTLAGPYAIGR